ncbi:unnamed protein product, partial [Phytomonas sp. Hart1]
MRDALALPLLFNTRPGVAGVADGGVGIREGLEWLFTRRGPALQPLLEVVASIPAKTLGPRAELLLCIVPLAGRGATRFHRLGWDRMLGTFREALGLVMLLNGVEGGLAHAIALAPEDAHEPAESTLIRRFGLRPLETVDLIDPETHPTLDDAPLTQTEASPTTNIDTLREKIIDCFVDGMHMCRKIIHTKPISLLTSGAEAIDFSLLRDNPSKSIQLAKLMHIPAKRQTLKMQTDLKSLAEWAGELILKADYMRAYVREHAFWLGFGSGTSETFLENPTLEESGEVKPNFHVKGFRNIVVGDSSSIPNALFSSKFVNFNSLSAGGIATAIDTGRLAAKSLVVR